LITRAVSPCTSVARIGTWNRRVNAKLGIDFVPPRSVGALENLEFTPTEDLEQGFLPLEADEGEQEGEGDAR